MHKFGALNRLVTATDPTGATTTFSYDAAGNVASVQSPTGETTAYTYDEENRVATIDDPARGLTTITRDGNGNVTKVTDALGNATDYVYDAEDRLIRMVDATLGERVFAYDASDNLASVTDARGNTTTFIYDDLDRLTTRTDPLGKIRSFSYDARDNLVSTTDPKSQTVTATYDDLSRLLALTTPDNALSFGYDARGALLTASDADSALTFTYDALARLETVATTGGIGPQPGVTITNAWDLLSNRTGLTDTLGGDLAFAWDGADRLTSLTIAAAGPTVGLGYDAAGRVTGVTYPNAVAMSASYDAATDRLAELAHSLGAADLARFLYAYNAVGSITGISEPSGTERSFGYDALQRLISGGTTAAPESYSYDAEGNRLVNHLSSAHLTDAGNRLLQDDAFDYAYDENGNLASKTDRATLAVTSYSYDAQDQLTRIDFPDGTFATYAYDALGRRIAKDVDDGAGGREVTAYLYDGPDILIETDGTGALLARYAHGDRVDQPLAMTRAGQDYYLHADHQGSIVRVTDSAGAVVNSYTYDAYGRRLAATEGVELPYGYTGREFDAESGLMYYRARMYDPATGRFLQTDPLGFAAGDLNTYRYVRNNPVNLSDPTGLFVGPVPAAGAGAGLAAGEGFLIGAGTVAAIAAPIVAYIYWDEIADFFDGSDTDDGRPADDCADDERCEETVSISQSLYPEVTAHMQDAVVNGHPSTLTLDRPGRNARRRDALRPYSDLKAPGKSRDEKASPVGSGCARCCGRRRDGRAADLPLAEAHATVGL